MSPLRATGLMLAAIAIVAAAGTATLICDPGLLAGSAERVGSALLGRQLKLERLSIRWNNSIRLGADNVRVANASWGSAADMMSIRRLEADVEVWPLLVGRLVLRSISMTAPELLLETSISGEGNWSDLPWLASRRSQIPRFRKAVIEDGAATIHSIATGATLDADRLQVRAMAPDSVSPVMLAFAGRVQNQPFRLEGTAGNWSLLHASAQPYPLALQGEFAGLRMAVDGTSMEPLRGSGTRIHFAMGDGSLRGMSKLFRLPLPETPDFSATGDITRGQGEWSLNHFESRIGTSVFTGEAWFDPYRPTPRLRMTLHSAKANLGDFASILNSEFLRPLEPKRDAKPSGLVIPDAKLPLEMLAIVDADISLAVGRLVGAAGLPLRQTTMRMVLDGGRLRVDPLEVAVANGRITTNLEYAPGHDAPFLKLKSELRGVDVDRLLADVPGPQMMKRNSVTVEGFVQMEAKGATPRELSSSLNGDLGISLQEGTINELTAAALQSDIPRMIGLGGNGGGTVQLNCLVSHFLIREGIAVTSPFVIDTEDMTVRITGRLSFRDETLLLDFVPHFKRYHPLKLGTPFKLRGSFENPRLQQSSDGPMASVGSTVATLIPPELDGSKSTPASSDRKGRDVCRRAKAEAQGSSSHAIRRTPSGAPQSGVGR